MKTQYIFLALISILSTNITFGQVDKLTFTKSVKDEMKKSIEGDTLTTRIKTKLEWDDLKMEPDSNSNQIVHIELIFQVYQKKINFWTGVLNVESVGGIRRDLSWIKQEYKKNSYNKGLSNVG